MGMRLPPVASNSRCSRLLCLTSILVIFVTESPCIMYFTWNYGTRTLTQEIYIYIQLPFSFTPYIYYITDTSLIHWLLIYTTRTVSVYGTLQYTSTAFRDGRNLIIQKLFCLAIRLEVQPVNQLTILCFSDVAR